ncbi:UNVERIFIED_CONTAM: flagellar assembly protein FliH [Acetivibrio alkalicellulosi]
MHNKVFKSNQINVGIPVQIRTPINFHTIKKIEQPQMDNEDLINEQKERADRIIDDAKELAEDIIKEAELEAVKLIEAAQREGDKLMASIEEEARSKGFEKGYNEAKKQYEDLLQEAESTKEHASLEYREIIEGIERDIVDIILDVAKKVIGEEITLNKENILELIRQGVEKCSNKEHITIKVSPQDYDFVIENRDKIYTLAEGIGKLDIKKDLSLKTGACIIETPYGIVDSGVGTKLDKIEEAFLKLLGKNY